jgi:hypothetical protein
MSTSSVNIVVPSEVRQLPGLPTIMEDPHIAGALAELAAPRQIGETTQRYEQRRAAAGRYQEFPAPTFLGQAGERSEQKTEQAAPPIINKQSEPEEELLVPLPKKKLKKIPMAEKLDDRIAYQRMRNEDMSSKGGSRYADQGIVFSTNGNVIDEMK